MSAKAIAFAALLRRVVARVSGRRSNPRAVALARQVGAIAPWDRQEAGHVAEVLAWIGSGAPLYRTRKPDIPDPHLVSYFVGLSPREELLLVAHRAAGLWLPSGGHVEPGEDPWETVVRECAEELHLPAVAHPRFGERPFFVTVTRTRGEGPHTDVSLWYVLDIDQVTTFDQAEFTGIRWVTPPRLLEEPIERLDPHLHRFTRKLMAALTPSDPVRPPSAPHSPHP
ncbi:NUDIX domain-containing protein [Nonomuraea solani]|nr:NUDIX domain-containing protein [Nonomuraea solani]